MHTDEATLQKSKSQKKDTFWHPIWKNRSLTAKMTFSDFRARYAGTALGGVWAVIQPIITIAIYAFVFAVGFKSQPVNGVPYVLWLVVGIVPWMYFVDIFSGASGSIPEYAYLVKKTTFPAQLLPMIKANSAGFMHGVFATLAGGLFMLVGHSSLSAKMIQANYFSFCILVFGLGFGYLFAALTPFFKDASQIVAILIQIGFWATPIAYNASIMSPRIQTILRLNPVYYCIQGWRNSFTNGAWFWEQPLWMLYFWGTSAVIWVIAIRVFKRFSPMYADVL